jgi:NADPH2:quinone reductase
MRCVVIQSFGKPSEVLELGEHPLPEPGPGEVRLQLILSPIHNHDLAIVRGAYGYRPPLPAIPGTEAVADVAALGPGVSHLSLGQRVCVAGASATWAEYFIAKAAAVVPLPEAVPDETACQLLAMPLSASMLLEDLQMKPGDWLIQNAANGAVGKVVNVLARKRGLHVVNVVRRRAGVDEMLAAGAEHVLATEELDWAARVARITGGAPVLRAVDSIGGRAANDLMNVMAPGGLLMVFGAMSGEPLSIDVGQVIFKQTTIRGFWGSKRSEATSGADKQRLIGELVQLAAGGALRLPVAGSYELSQAAEAAAASEQPGKPGKVVLRAD